MEPIPGQGSAHRAYDQVGTIVGNVTAEGSKLGDKGPGSKGGAKKPKTAVKKGGAATSGTTAPKK